MPFWTEVAAIVVALWIVDLCHWVMVGLLIKRFPWMARRGVNIQPVACVN